MLRILSFVVGVLLYGGAITIPKYAPPEPPIARAMVQKPSKMVQKELPGTQRVGDGFW